MDGYNGPYINFFRAGATSHHHYFYSGPFSCSQVREDGPGGACRPGPNGLPTSTGARLLNI